MAEPPNQAERQQLRGPRAVRTAVADRLSGSYGNTMEPVKIAFKIRIKGIQFPEIDFSDTAVAPKNWTVC